MRGNAHVRFGGRGRETEPGKPDHRALSRPYTCPPTLAAATSSTTSSAVAIKCAPPSSPPTSRSSSEVPSSPVRPASPHSSIGSPSPATPSTSMPTPGARGISDDPITRASLRQNHAALQAVYSAQFDQLALAQQQGCVVAGVANAWSKIDPVTTPGNAKERVRTRKSRVRSST